MALTFGTGPFGKQPAGHFDVEPPTRPLLFWEPFLPRFRVVIGGETVADSRRAIALHETGQLLRLGVPEADVRRELLEAGPTAAKARTGTVRSWSGRTAAGATEAVAHSVEAPPAAAAALQGLFFFDLAKVDAWYLENDLGYAHPRDPYHRCDVHHSSQHVVVRLGDVVLAETSAPAVLFETSIAPRFYLAPDAVRTGLLVKSDTVSECPYKGDGQHWHVVVEGQRIEDAAWSLTTPMGDALIIPRWFSFYPEKLRVEVDGQRLQP